jgi:LacI family transcriptional regulator
MKTTIKDVARLAGVSVGTASNVMNNRGNVQHELRSKVWDAAGQLNYQANGIARSLRSSSTRTLGVLLADITNPFQMTLARGIEEVMYESGYHHLISSTQENPVIERTNLAVFYEKRVDGIILCTTGKVNDEIRSLVQRGIPIVLVDRPDPSLSLDMVADDNLLGTELLVNHLCELGHQRIGVIHGDLNTIHGRLRHEGVLKALGLHGIPVAPELHTEGGFSFDGGYSAVKRFFGLDHPPTALLSANNNMTAGVLRACRDLNIHVPNDVSVVSFGDLEYAWNLITPSITVVTQSPLAIGRKAAELILNRLNGESEHGVSHVFMAPQLIARESSGPCSA